MAFPQIRDWLTFTTERSTERHVALIVGVASRAPDPILDPFLRPIGPGTEARGHFHAALFPYRPLPRGELTLSATVNNLVGREAASGMLHLLSDDRPFEGVGQSELFRGACWTGPLSTTPQSPNPGPA